MIRIGGPLAQAIALVLILAGISPSWAVAGDDRPNVILMIADDLGYGEVGVFRQGDIPTPHINSIGRSGVLFTDGYVTSPFCSASRAGLMTGRIPNRFGYEFNPIGADNENPEAGIPGSELTVGEAFQRNGYATGLVGKWHLGGTAAYHPNRNGFEYFYGFMHEGHFFVPWPYEGVVTMLRRASLPDGGRGRWINADQTLVLSTHMNGREPDYDADNPILRQGQPVDEKDYLTDAITRESVKFIEYHKERPFFLCVSYSAVHSPLQGTLDYMKKFEGIEDIHRRIFAAMLAHMDDSVGAILKKLNDLQLSDNTIIIFLSDNGGPTRELTSSNLPLNGGKGTVFEGGIRVPMMLQWPSRISPGKVVDHPVSSLDLFPTLLKMAGIDPPRADRLDGISWWDREKKSLDWTGFKDRSLFWKLGDRHALRSGNWKILRQKQKKWQLFHLGQDMNETSDLSDAYPDKTAQLDHIWENYQSQMIPPRWKRK